MNKIGILGTGNVGHTLGNRLIELGYEVMMGSRSKANEKAMEWASGKNSNAYYGSFSDAAKFSDQLLLNCVKGEFALEALKLCGKENLKGQVLVDISNPLVFSNGMPPSLSVCNDISLAELIQIEFPDTRVVKSLNTMTASIMLNPTKLSGDHNVFVSGNTKESKSAVVELLQRSGWKSENIIDLGDLSTARGTEMVLPLWIRLWGALGTADFNFYIQKG